MDTRSSDLPSLGDEWCAHHFDFVAPEFRRAECLDDTLDRMRAVCPVAHSDRHGGHWVLTRYDDVLRVAQSWQSFSSSHGVTPGPDLTHGVVPSTVDPPLHRAYRQVINRYFTPAVVAGYAAATRAVVTQLIDEFVEAGACEFMDAFARPLPGTTFFDLVVHAPADEIAELKDVATKAVMPGHPEAAASMRSLYDWSVRFLDDRRGRAPCGDVIDAIVDAEVEGRPITPEERVGLVTILAIGGLETTSSALGQFMIRFCRQPEIPALLRAHPELVPRAVEELLRLHPPSVAIARTVVHDVEIDDQELKAGEKALIYWLAANRDPAEFPEPSTFDLDRASIRHLSFGAGPHRCPGSNLARMNLQIAVGELVGRLHEIHLQDGAEPISFVSQINRSPLAVPIAFTPGPRRGGADHVTTDRPGVAAR